MKFLLFLFFSLFYFTLAEHLSKQLRKKLWHMSLIVSRISDTVLYATIMKIWGIHDPSVDGWYWEKTPTTTKPNPQKNCSLNIAKMGQTGGDLLRVILANNFLNLALCIILIEWRTVSVEGYQTRRMTRLECKVVFVPWINIWNQQDTLETRREHYI